MTDKDKKGQLCVDLGGFNPVDLRSCRDDLELRQALLAAEPVKVRVRIEASDRELKCQIDSLRLLQERGSQDIWAILLGNDYSKLPELNSFRSLDATQQQLVQSLENGGFNDMQREAAALTCKAPAAMSYIQGSTACGKTHFLLHMALQFIRFPSKNPRRANTNRHQVLIAAPINDLVDDLARKLKEVCDLHIKDRPTVVIRYHAYETEYGVVKQPADRVRPKPDTAQPDISQEDESQLLDGIEAAQLIKRLYEEATYQPRGIADRRLKQLDLSLGVWMLKFAGIIEDSVSDPDKFINFRALYSNYKNSDEMTKEDEFNLRSETKAVRNYVLHHADAVVTTLSNCADAPMRLYVKPDFIGVDEAGKATEPKLWPVLAGYTPYAFVQVGDIRQIGPVVLSATPPKGSKPFAEHLRFSNFARTISNGFPTVMLDVQYRMVPDIGDLVNVAFLEGKLKHGPSTGNRPRSDLFVKHNTDNYGKGSALLLFNTKESTSVRDTSQSFYNVVNAVLGLDKVFELLSIKIRPEELMILVPYNAQVKVYASGLSRMQHIHPDLDLQGITIRTIDKAQNLERPFVILDLVVTETFGFIDSPRLYAAESRARDGMYMILNVAAVDRMPAWKSRVISKTLTHIKRKKLIVVPEEKRESEYLSAANLPLER